jgi:hypothetical protein
MCGARRNSPAARTVHLDAAVRALVLIVLALLLWEGEDGERGGGGRAVRELAT